VSRDRSVTLFAKHEPTLTGTARYAAALADELARLGWRVRGRASRSPLPGWLGAAARRRGFDLAAVWASYPLVPPRADGSVLHLTSQTVATAVALARPPGPLVVTVHDILPWVLRHDPELATLRQPLDRALYRLALRGLAAADLLLADSRATADDLSRELGVRDDALAVVPLGVDGERFRPSGRVDEARRRYVLPRECQHVIYVGSEDPRKNLTTLVEAFARVAARHPSARLVKVGAAHHAGERGRLRALAERRGIADRVRFLDQVPEADLAPLYGAAAVCAIPSRHEGFGLPVLEAMACGVPVVCANRSSLPEVAGDAALVVEPTPEAFAEAIGRLLDDAALRSDLRQRGLSRAAGYTWRRTAELTAECYRLARTARPRRR
jgi:glycosyltransferase involved in cell wall biosynthesis